MDKIKIQVRKTDTVTKKFELDFEGQLKKVSTNENEPQYDIILSEIRDKVMELYTTLLIIPIDEVDTFISCINQLGGGTEKFEVPSSWNVQGKFVTVFSTDDGGYMIEIFDPFYPTFHENYRRTINIPEYEMEIAIKQIDACANAIETMEGVNDG